ncbi:MAG: class I SAM-dependent methyltransferase [Bacteroidota bacterium]
MGLYLTTKDFSVSSETFELHYEHESKMLITHPHPEDLAPYYDSEAYISHTDSNASMVDWLYQRVKAINLRKKIQTIENQGFSKVKLLDFGAGTGDFLKKAKAKGFKVRGIEPNKKARQNAVKKGISLSNHINHFSGDTFDVITLWHVLEHLPDLNTQLKQVLALLDANGMLVVAVPNYKSYDAKHYGRYWAGYDVPRHLWHFSRTAIHQLFDQHHMQVIAIRPMLFDAFYVSLLSEKYKGNRLALINAFIIGLWSNLRACFSKEYSSLIYVLKRKN